MIPWELIDSPDPHGKWFDEPPPCPFNGVAEFFNHKPTKHGPGGESRKRREKQVRKQPIVSRSNMNAQILLQLRGDDDQ